MTHFYFFLLFFFFCSELQHGLSIFLKKTSAMSHAFLSFRFTPVHCGEASQVCVAAEQKTKMLNSSVETIGCLSCLHLSSSLHSKKKSGAER